jgi:hypothetical protein
MFVSQFLQNRVDWSFHHLLIPKQNCTEFSYRIVYPFLCPFPTFLPSFPLRHGISHPLFVKYKSHPDPSIKDIENTQAYLHQLRRRSPPSKFASLPAFFGLPKSSCTSPSNMSHPPYSPYTSLAPVYNEPIQILQENPDLPSYSRLNTRPVELLQEKKPRRLFGMLKKLTCQRTPNLLTS